tara:strand:+ start:812 stop:1804 length:993 start_codon:yes stop_codon:yes gene_type:complete
MAYIGKEPTVGNFQVCDAISVVNGQAAYTMQVSSTNVTPESANHMLVSLNGILQKPNSSFTVSGSTITFASNLATGDVIDFIMLLGNVLDLGTPSDSTVTDAKTNFVSTSSAAGLQIRGDGTTDGTLQLNCSQNSHGIKLKSPAHSASASYTLTFPTTDGNNEEFLQTNGSGVLTWATAGGGITEADMFRLTANITSNTDPISSNLERVDDATFSKIGTGMTNNSGHFSFPSTGLYHIMYNYKMTWSSSDSTNFMLSVSTDSASSYDNVAHVDQPGTEQQQSANHAFVNVTNASTFRVKFHTSSQSSSTITGNTDANYTTFTFIRLGDSQ